MYIATCDDHCIYIYTHCVYILRPVMTIQVMKPISVITSSAGIQANTYVLLVLLILSISIINIINI